MHEFMHQRVDGKRETNKGKTQPVFSAMTAGNGHLKTTISSRVGLFFPGDEEPILRRRKKKTPTSDSSTKTDINIHSTWSRFQNRTSYWSLTNLSAVSAAYRRPLVADLPVTDSHSPLFPRCCLAKRSPEPSSCRPPHYLHSGAGGRVRNGKFPLERQRLTRQRKGTRSRTMHLKEKLCLPPRAMFSVTPGLRNSGGAMDPHSRRDLRYGNISSRSVIVIKRWVRVWDRVQTNLNAQQEKPTNRKSKKWRQTLKNVQSE